MSVSDSTWTAVRVLGQPAYVSQQLSSLYEINRSGTSVRMRPSSSSSPNNIHTIHTSIPFGLNGSPNARSGSANIVVRLPYTLRLSRGALLHAAHAESFRSSLQLPPASEFAWNATIPSYLTVGVAQLMLWSWHGDSTDINGTSTDVNGDSTAVDSGVDSGFGVSTGHEPNTNKTTHRRAIQIQSDRPLDLSLSNLRWQSMPYGAARHVTKRYWRSHGGNPKNWHYRHYELTIDNGDESNPANHDNNNSFWGSHAVVFRLARLYMARPDLDVMHALLEQFQRPIDTLAPNDTYQGQVLLPEMSDLSAEDTMTTTASPTSVSFTVRRAPTLVAPLAADEQWVEFDADWRGLGPVSSAGVTPGMTAGLHYQVSQYGRVKMRKVYADGDTDEVLLIPKQFNNVDPSQSNHMLIYRCNTIPPKLLSVAYVLPEPLAPRVRLTPLAESLTQEHRKQMSSEQAYLQHWSLRHIRIDTLVMTTFRHAETMQLLSALSDEAIDEVKPLRVVLKHGTHPAPSSLFYNHVDNLEYRSEPWRTVRSVNDMGPDMDQEGQSTQSTAIDSRVTWRDYQLNRQWHMMISQIRALVRRLKFLSSS